MNRRLHNAMTASVATGALFLLGLAAIGPGPAPRATTAGYGGQQALSVAAVAARPSRSGPRRHRQRLVMPYFSFSRS